MIKIIRANSVDDLQRLINQESKYTLKQFVVFSLTDYYAVLEKLENTND